VNLQGDFYIEQRFLHRACKKSPILVKSAIDLESVVFVLRLRSTSTIISSKAPETTKTTKTTSGSL
jgi:hypothetical protein